MKVCIVTQQYGRRWSGLGTYATNLVEGLVERGITVTVICPEGMGNDDKVKIVPVRMRGWEKGVNYWLPLARQFRKALIKLFRNDTYDVVHFTDAREALFAPKLPAKTVGTMNDYYAADAPANPFYFRKHYSDWPIRYPYYQFMRWVEPVALKKLDKVIANSRYVKDVLLKNYSLDAGRVSVINYGIDAGVAWEDENELAGDPSILFVGANFQRKGLPDLLKAAAVVRENLDNLVVHVVGEDKKADVAKEMAARLGISNAVRFHGLVPNDDVRKMKADMFVMPSLVEGFGIVFLEAMMSEIPVIGGNVGGTVELIRDGVNGFTVNPGDVEGLAGKIIQLSGDGKLRRAFIEEGMKTAKEYTIPEMVGQTIELYERL